MLQVLTTISVILSIIVSLLQIFGVIDFITPIFAFLTTYVPIYYTVLFVASCIILYLIIRRIMSFSRGGRRYTNILDLSYGRRIAILCQTPRTTQFLRQQYDEWKSQIRGFYLGGYNFDDYMKRLEKEGYIEYIDNNWVVTREALSYIRKYHGG